jgi:Ser/Thr protein kinase RdoA (MazF antagonist)
MTPGPLLVHGMGRELVPPAWAPLTGREVTGVLRSYGLAGSGRPAGPLSAVVTWRSPRPMSAAGLVSLAGPGDVATGETLFVKRHGLEVRSPAQLAAEHAFARHLRVRGLPVPAVLAAADGATVIRHGNYAYEVHRRAPGLDLYRDAPSWTPFRSAGHAHAAGAMLARLHLAAESFGQPARPFAPLMTSCEVISASDPVRQVEALAARWPALGHYLAQRPWRQDVGQHLLPSIRRAQPALAGLPRCWVHGDWHPSNLTWTSAASSAGVAGIIDLGLANLTYAVHDLAIALERSVVSWLDLAECGEARADLDAAGALIDGYESVRPLAPAEAAVLPDLLTVCHVEYALSEIAYFAGAVRSPADAGLGYDYLVGHCRWFATSEGVRLLGYLRCRARR